MKLGLRAACLLQGGKKKESSGGGFGQFKVGIGIELDDCWPFVGEKKSGDVGGGGWKRERSHWSGLIVFVAQKDRWVGLLNVDLGGKKDFWVVRFEEGDAGEFRRDSFLECSL